MSNNDIVLKDANCRIDVDATGRITVRLVFDNETGVQFEPTADFADDLGTGLREAAKKSRRLAR